MKKMFSIRMLAVVCAIALVQPIEAGKGRKRGSRSNSPTQQHTVVADPTPGLVEQPAPPSTDNNNSGTPPNTQVVSDATVTPAEPAKDTTNEPAPLPTPELKPAPEPVVPEMDAPAFAALKALVEVEKMFITDPAKLAKLQEIAAADNAPQYADAKAMLELSKKYQDWAAQLKNAAPTWKIEKTDAKPEGEFKTGVDKEIEEWFKGVVDKPNFPADLKEFIRMHSEFAARKFELAKKKVQLEKRKAELAEAHQVAAKDLAEAQGRVDQNLEQKTAELMSNFEGVALDIKKLAAEINQMDDLVVAKAKGIEFTEEMKKAQSGMLEVQKEILQAKASEEKMSLELAAKQKEIDSFNDQLNNATEAGRNESQETLLKLAKDKAGIEAQLKQVSADIEALGKEKDARDAEIEQLKAAAQDVKASTEYKDLDGKYQSATNELTALRSWKSRSWRNPLILVPVTTATTAGYIKIVAPMLSKCAKKQSGIVRTALQMLAFETEGWNAFGNGVVTQSKAAYGATVGKLMAKEATKKARSA
jgi:hypothetical protein